MKPRRRSQIKGQGGLGPEPSTPTAGRGASKHFLFVVNRQGHVPVDVRFYQRVLCRLLSLSRRSSAVVGLMFVNDRQMRQMNRRYRRIDRPTDVLAFPAVSTGGNGAPVVLGDVVISVDTARRQARQTGTAFQEECRRLLIHGYLHLLGYDHDRSRRDAVRMRRLERRMQTRLTER
jgi:probable rRNA maturation factor